MSNGEFQTCQACTTPMACRDVATCQRQYRADTIARMSARENVESLLGKRVGVNSGRFKGQRGLVTHENSNVLKVQFDKTQQTALLQRVEVMREEAFDQLYGKPTTLRVHGYDNTLAKMTASIKRVDELRGKRKEPKKVVALEWKLHPTPTYRWGVIPINLRLEDNVRCLVIEQQRWFKSKRRAVAFARFNYTTYVIADYQER